MMTVIILTVQHELSRPGCERGQLVGESLRYLLALSSLCEGQSWALRRVVGAE